MRALSGWFCVFHHPLGVFIPNIYHRTADGELLRTSLWNRLDAELAEVVGLNARRQSAQNESCADGANFELAFDSSIHRPSAHSHRVGPRRLWTELSSGVFSHSENAHTVGRKRRVFREAAVCRLQEAALFNGTAEQVQLLRTTKELRSPNELHVRITLASDRYASLC